MTKDEMIDELIAKVGKMHDDIARFSRLATEAREALRDIAENHGELVKLTRIKALEQAAQICERHDGDLSPFDCAQIIRALKGKP